MELVNYGPTAMTMNPAADALHRVERCVARWMKGDPSALDKACKRVEIYKSIDLNMTNIEHMMLMDYFQVILQYLSAVQIGNHDMIEERAAELVKFYQNV